MLVLFVCQHACLVLRFAQSDGRAGSCLVLSQICEQEEAAGRGGEGQRERQGESNREKELVKLLCYVLCIWKFSGYLSSPLTHLHALHEKKCCVGVWLDYYYISLFLTGA